MPDHSGLLLTVPVLDLQMRPVAIADALTVCHWRNSDDARHGFFSTHVLTPEHHAEFIRSRPPGDHTWMCIRHGGPVGMGGLIVDPESHSAEAGRLFVDLHHRQLRHTLGIPLALCYVAFDVLQVDHLWCDVLTDNTAALKLNRLIGYQGVGVDVPGHTHPRGPVTHMERFRRDWQGLEHWCRELQLEAK